MNVRLSASWREADIAEDITRGKKWPQGGRRPRRQGATMANRIDVHSHAYRPVGWRLSGL
jgi:hypothetical protein